MINRICKVCGLEKPLEEFTIHPLYTYGRTYRCKVCTSLYNKNWVAKNRERLNKSNRQWRREHRSIVRKQERAYYQKLRLEVLSHYSNGKPHCACCGEELMEFLTIDHICGGGGKHCKSVRGKFYHWLKRNKFPLGYRVLCWNCNMAIGHYGYCPHQKVRG